MRARERERGRRERENRGHVDRGDGNGGGSSSLARGKSIVARDNASSRVFYSTRVAKYFSLFLKISYDHGDSTATGSMISTHSHFFLSSFSFSFLFFPPSLFSHFLRSFIDFRRWRFPRRGAPKYPRDSRTGRPARKLRAIILQRRREQAPTTVGNVYSTIYRV